MLVCSYTYPSQIVALISFASSSPGHEQSVAIKYFDEPLTLRNMLPYAVPLPVALDRISH